MNLFPKDKSTAVLIAVNILPIVGVILFNWDAVMIVMFYCVETFIIGVFNIFKMIQSKAEIPKKLLESSASNLMQINSYNNSPGLMKFTMIPFFIVHYNGFVIVQTIMIIVVSNTFSDVDYETSNFYSIDFIINVLLIIYSHYYSYKKNFIGKEEYNKVNLLQLMFAPYKRVLIQQFTVILGGFFIFFFQGPLGFLILLIGLKLIIDIRSHNKSHDKFNNFDDKAIQIQKDRHNF